MDTPAPKVFISYSHDSPEHEEQVLALSDRLREDGIDCRVDQYEDPPPIGWQRWMMDQIEECDFVLLVCTETYMRRFRGKEDPGKGLGVNFEGDIITQELYDAALHNTRFIPVGFSVHNPEHVPLLLRNTAFYNLNNPEEYESLYRRLTNQPSTPARPVGRRRTLPPRERQSMVPLEPLDPQEAELPPFHLGEVHGAPFLVGRESDVENLKSLLQPGQVVCLRGEGGIGKTALAVEVAYQQRERFSGGVLGLSLGTLPSLERVLQHLGHWLLGEGWNAIPEEERRAQVIAALRKRSMLLVLDNYETVTRDKRRGSQKGGVLGSFFRDCLGKRSQSVLLITSREPTDLPSEQPFFVSDLSQDATVDLFRKWATLKPSDSEENLNRLMETLGGHPLAIEMIAGAYKSNGESLDEILVRVEARLPSEKDLARPKRQKTLRACFGYSVNYLKEVQKRFFLTLGLFRGPFTPEAAGAISGHDNPNKLLQSLHERSLLRYHSPDDTGCRVHLYSLHPMMRLYIRERTKAEDQTIHRRALVDHYAALATEAWEGWEQEPGWALLLRALWADLEQAQAWVTGETAADFSSCLGWLAIVLGELGTASAFFERVLALPSTPPDLVAKAQRGLGWIAHERGQWDVGESCYQRAGWAFEEAGDRHGQATILDERARLRANRGNQGDFAEAEDFYNQALSLLADDVYGKARIRHNWAVLDRLRGEFIRAQETFEAVLLVFESVGNQPMTAAVKHELGYLAFVRGEYDRAQELYKDSLEINQELGARWQIPTTLHNLGEAHAEKGEWGLARKRQEKAEEIFTQFGHHKGQAETSRALGQLDRLAGDPASAEDRCQKALGLQKQIDDRRGQAATLLELAAVRQSLACFDEALALIAEARSLAEQGEDRLGQAHAHLRRTQVLAETDDLPGALAAGWEAWGRYNALGVAGEESAQQELKTLRTCLGEAFAEVWRETTADAPWPDWLS